MVSVRTCKTMINDDGNVVIIISRLSSLKSLFKIVAISFENKKEELRVPLTLVKDLPG